MAKFNPITFTLAEDNKKVVVADRYVPNALLMQNKPIYEGLGGKRIEGIKECRIEFPTAAKAKKFAEQAICKMSAKEYKAARKVAEGTEKPKVQAKGNAKSARKGKGNAPTKAITQAKKGKDTTNGKEVKKGKGNAPELTDAGKKTLERMKMSVLNRAASAYSLANGGEATTFSALGKSAEALKSHIPAAKAGLLKSPKWSKAVEKYGLTEDMLG
jgi:hypothetical protein